MGYPASRLYKCYKYIEHDAVLTIKILINMFNKGKKFTQSNLTVMIHTHLYCRVSVCNCLCEIAHQEFSYHLSKINESHQFEENKMEGN